VAPLSGWEAMLSRSVNVKGVVTCIIGPFVVLEGGDFGVVADCLGVCSIWSKSHSSSR